MAAPQCPDNFCFNFLIHLRKEIYGLWKATQKYQTYQTYIHFLFTRRNLTPPLLFSAFSVFSAFPAFFSAPHFASFPGASSLSMPLTPPSPPDDPCPLSGTAQSSQSSPTQIVCHMLLFLHGVWMKFPVVQYFPRAYAVCLQVKWWA
jgi:hypothetical protein